MAAIEGPNCAARERGRAIIREALRSQREAAEDASTREQLNQRAISAGLKG